MTQREREILKASVSWTDKTLTVNEEKAFQAGAKWADKTMIEKAKAWVKNSFIGPFGEGLADNIANEFAKYLEE